MGSARVSSNLIPVDNIFKFFVYLRFHLRTLRNLTEISLMPNSIQDIVFPKILRYFHCSKIATMIYFIVFRIAERQLQRIQHNTQIKGYEINHTQYEKHNLCVRFSHIYYRNQNSYNLQNIGKATSLNQIVHCLSTFVHAL